ncbi:MAG: VOC family protein [Gammaproteobacteria bacterium]|nr:VOC family protein [Gammaproteobacteria bacterium]MYK45726.1 VOC family protein [Gammaproteobacteria bacterium]
MGPLGFYSICLKTDHLEETVAFYRRLGFRPVGEDAPGLRVSLANGDYALTFMTFLDANLINFRGAHIHRLMHEILTAGVVVTGYNEMPDQQPLTLDEEGKPLPDNECGHFTVQDPDGHELFFNTHPHERAPFEAALAGEVEKRDQDAGSLGRLVYCLDVTDLDASLAFYQTIGLRGFRGLGGAWVTPPARNRAIHFVLQLRESRSPGSFLRFYGDVANGDLLSAEGFDPEANGWAGVDPDGRRLEFLGGSMLPR